MTELDSRLYRKTEWLLYDYPTFESAIKVLQAELEAMLPAPTSSVAGVGRKEAWAPGDTSETERWAILRHESPRARRLWSELRKKHGYKAGIEDALELLSDEERELVRLNYWEQRTNAQCAGKLGIPSRTFDRMKRQVVETVAKCLGYF